MKALILAGGFGTRLKEVIHDRPKVMASIKNRPFLEHIFEILRKNRIDNLVISLGYLGDYIKDFFGDGERFGVNVKYSDEDYPLGTAGAIKKAERYFKDTFLIINGDTYLDIDISKVLDFHKKKKAILTIVLSEGKDLLRGGGVTKNRSGIITNFFSKTEKNSSKYVDSGYRIADPKLFKMILQGKRSSLEKDIIPKLIRREEIYGYAVENKFLDISSPGKYEQARKILLKKKRRVISTEAPVRISLAGGGTDLPVYFEKFGGSVVSFTINKYAYVTIRSTETPHIRVILQDYQKERKYPLGKILPYDGSIFDLHNAIISRVGIVSGTEIIVKGDFPGGSGLGTSSAVAVALISALLKYNNQKLTKQKVARLAVEVERELLKIPGGWQDQYASSFGGLNFIRFLPGGKVKLTKLPLSRNRLEELENNLMLFYVHAKRSEQEQQRVLNKNILAKDETINSFEKLKKTSLEVCDILNKGKVDQLGGFIHEAWIAKKNSSDRISTPLINKLYESALKRGASGGKLLGAGGGGCLLIQAQEKHQRDITGIFDQAGARLIPFKIESNGLKVREYEN